MTSAFVVAAAPALRAGLRAMLEQGGVEVAGEGPDLPSDGLGEVVVLAGTANPEELTDLHGPTVLLADGGGQGALLQRRGLPGWAVLPSNASADQLLAAVNAVVQGLVVVPADQADGLATPPVEVSDPLQEPLTPRELEVLQLVSHGLSNKLIARALGISEHTVKFHVSSTYSKLGAASRTEAVSLAARKGLITL